jgi:SAM-dependent MidA family methyltransferase
VPSASDEIRAAIADANGSISFERFMDLALYGEHGFYTRDRSEGGGSAGRSRGDFITSPEVGPLFGAVLARALDAWWRDLGEPEVFTVVDAGAGPGTLARSVLAAKPACADSLDYVAVEISAAQRERHPEGVMSSATMPTEPFTGVIIANELLDNLPFRLFVMDGEWREAHVVAQPDGRFAEILRPAADAGILGLPEGAPHGARAPVQGQAASWAVTSRFLLTEGRLVILDYARASTAEFASRPWRDWLRTYRGHERGDHYLRDPGQQDITVDVALDQLAAAIGTPDAMRTQSQFLQRWGIDGLVDEGRRVWSEHAARPTVATMTMRSRVREAEALLAEPGLGAFSVLEHAVHTNAVSVTWASAE